MYINNATNQNRWVYVRVAIYLFSAQLSLVPATVYAESSSSVGPQPFSDRADCLVDALSSPLSLYEAVNRALCQNPQTRQSWAAVSSQAAQVGVARAEYFPSLTAGGTLDQSATKNSVRDNAELDSYSRITSKDASLGLSWVLFDFGLRSANLESARHLLRATDSIRIATLQAVFLNTTQAYYDVWSAQASLLAAQEAEKSAQKSFQAAQRKHEIGTGTLSDQLQAKTAYAQATLNRVNADGVLKSTQGALAISMGLAATTAITIDPEVGAQPSIEFHRSIDELLDFAKKNNPTLLAAQYQVSASQAKLKATLAEGRPTISFTSQVSREERIPQIGDETLTRERSIGLQVSIPLFKGFSSVYQARDARAQIDASQAAMEDADLQMALDVWKRFQDVRTQAQNLKAASTVQQSAKQAHKLSQRRYEVGIGTLVDLLTTQAAFSNSEQQLIQAQASWHMARFKLAASIGQLGTWEDN